MAPDVRFLRLKYTKIDFGWGSAPDPAGGAPPDSLAGFNRPTSKEREEKGKERRRKERGEEGRGNGCVMVVGGWMTLTALDSPLERYR